MFFKLRSLARGAVIAAAESIEIGDGSKVGDFSTIIDSNYHDLDPAHPDKPRPVTIGKNVWLGSGVLVLPGSEIGDHTVVAARSVVRGSLPPKVLASGNPAQVVKQLEIPDGWRRDTLMRAHPNVGDARRAAKQLLSGPHTGDIIVDGIPLTNDIKKSFFLKSTCQMAAASYVGQ